MEKLIVKPNKEGKYLVTLFGTTYEIVLEEVKEEKKKEKKTK